MPSLLASLLRTVSWPHWRAHAGRTSLTVVGVAIGVATVVSIATISASVLASFRHMVDTLAGPAELEVAGGGTGVAETLLAEVRAVPGVRDAGGLVEGFLPLANDPGETVLVLGVDLFDAQVWEEQFPRDAVHIDDQLRFVAHLDSVALPRPFLERHGLRPGDEIAVLAPDGRRSLRVRGVLDPRGPALLFGGALALMDLPAAQRLLGKEDRLDRIAILRDPGAEPAEVRERVAAAVGARGQVAAPEARGRQAERLLFSLRTTLLIMSLGAVIVGAFIVYQTIAVSVYERRRTLAVLNAVGVRRASLRRLCVTESALLASLGAAAGIGAGIAAARIAAGFVGGVASDIWVRVDATEHALSGGGIAAALAVAALAALGAAYGAARTTLAAPTVESLRGGAVRSRASAPLRTAASAGLLLAGVWLVAFAPPNLGLLTTVGVVIGTQSLGFIGLALLAPLFVRAAGTVARGALRAWNGFALRMAIENVLRETARSGATVATVAAAFSIAIIAGVFSASFDGAWSGWVRQHFAADLYVGRGDRPRLISGPPMDRALAAELAAIEGVAHVEPFRTLPVTFRDWPVFLQGMSIARRLETGGLPMVEGDLARAAPALLAGTGVLVSDNLAYRFGLHRGDRIELPTPAGPRTFRIEGTFVDYLGSLDLGSIVVDLRHLETEWRDSLANLFRVWVAPGAEPARVRSAILARLGAAQGLYVLTVADFVAAVRQIVDAFFAAVWALEVAAALVAVIGIVNAQAASVIDRARELTVLRAIGVPARALRRMVVLECGQIGLLGGIAGGAFGLLLGAQIVLASIRLVTGWQMAVVLPLATVAAGLVLVAGISALAGYLPARAAGRLAPVTAFAE